MACLLPKRNSRVSDLNRDEMESALAELAEHLNARDVKAKIYLASIHRNSRSERTRLAIFARLSDDS